MRGKFCKVTGILLEAVHISYGRPKRGDQKYSGDGACRLSWEHMAVLAAGIPALSCTCAFGVSFPGMSRLLCGGLRGNGAQARCLPLVEGCHVGSLAPGFELRYPTYVTPCTFRLIHQPHCMHRWLGQMWLAGAARDERCTLRGPVGAAGLLTVAGMTPTV